MARSTPPAPSQPPAGAPLRRALLGFAFGKLGWMIGAPLLVLACGFELMWWSFVQQTRLIGDTEARATQTVQARLVDRYYLLTRSPDEERCHFQCRIDQASVAVYEFEDGAGRTRRAEFRDEIVHDWQHNTPFELGIPVPVPRVRLAPEFHAWLQSQPSNTSGVNLWDDWWAEFDDAAHWLLRVRDPVPVVQAALRYDPADPAAALLDEGPLREYRESDARQTREVAWAMPLFVAVISFAVLWPAVQMMTYGLPRRASAAIALVIVAGVPLWGPLATRIAPWLSDTAGEFAQVLQRDFGGGPVHPAYLARPPTAVDGLTTIDWTLAGSQDAYFLSGVALRATDLPPLDHAAALDALQASLVAQLTPMDDAGLLAALEPLDHYQAGDVLELFVPALLALQVDTGRGVGVRAKVDELLAFFVHDFELPDVDGFRYEERLARYEKLTRSVSPEIARAARQRLAERRALIARQQATMR